MVLSSTVHSVEVPAGETGLPCMATKGPGIPGCPRVTLDERVYFGVEEAAKRQTALDYSSVLALGTLIATPQA